jgi:hypothetical protein
MRALLAREIGAERGGVAPGPSGVRAEPVGPPATATAARPPRMTCHIFLSLRAVFTP